MEDRYLFRGKRADNGEWVQGNLVNSVYKKNDTCVGTYGNNVGMHQVDPSTICQCTGLRDKTGKLIWENDIMEACLDEDFPESMTRVIVQWNGSGWATHQAGSIVDEYLDKFDTEHFAVISNKFDNPELLV